MKFYAVDEDQIARLRAVAKRLYTEERLDGDGMRDLAHTIASVTQVAGEIEVPSDFSRLVPAPACSKCGTQTWALDPRRGTCTPCSRGL